MNLREEILKEHSRRQADKIIRWIGTDRRKFDQLVSLFLKGEYRVTQRAGWPLSDIAMKHPEMISKYLKPILMNLKKDKLHNAVIRNSFRLLQFINLPKKLNGLAADISFRYFTDQSQSVAIHVFSMTALGNLCKEYPDLKNELIPLIRERLPYSTAGFRSRARKVLKQLEN
jgi:hypothetical protein